MGTGKVCLCFVLLSLLCANVFADPMRVSNTEEAAKIFERLAALDGEWIGKSTNGWESRVTFEVIAGGSVVIETSHFEAHPGQKMMTAYHPDRDRLVLTHYCVSGTQPRLEATTWDADRREVRFTFFDGASLESRDQGHMDSVVIRFIDDDHFSSRWTWYQNGVEKWLEDITYARMD